MNPIFTMGFTMDGSPVVTMGFTMGFNTKS